MSTEHMNAQRYCGEETVSDRFTAPMYRALWGPAMLSCFGWALSDIADAVVVGQALGTVGLAAISLILPVYMVNCTLVHGMGLGGSMLYAQLLSEGKAGEANANFRWVLTLSLLFSVATAVLGTVFLEPLLSLLGAVPTDRELYEATRDYLQILIASTPLFYLSNIFNYYLRNDAGAKRAGFSSVTGNLCDIALNVIFVTVMGLGTRGAALATTVGQIVAISLYLPGILRMSPRLEFSAQGLRSGLSCLSSGLASSVQYLYQMLFLFTCNNVLMNMSGEAGVAVLDVVQNTSYLILYLFEGTTRAMQPLLSTYFGEHNRLGRKTVTRLGFVSGMAVGGALALIVLLWPQGMCLLFGIAEGNAAYAIACFALRLYAVSCIFAGASILLISYYQSCNQERSAFLLVSLRGVILLLPLTFLFARLTVSRFWYLFPATEIGALALFLLLQPLVCRDGAEMEEARIFRRTILSTVRDVGEVSAEISEFCAGWEADLRQEYFVTMTVEEIGLAILTHGFHGRTDGYIQLTLIAQRDGSFELYLRDNATGFDPFSLATNKIDENDFDMDAMGMMVIKQKAKDFFYRRYQGFNSLMVRI